MTGDVEFPGVSRHTRDSNGAVASLASVAKLPFMDAQDGISNTFSVIPDALGKNTQIFTGEPELDGDCGPGDTACKVPTLFEGLDRKETS